MSEQKKLNTEPTPAIEVVEEEEVARKRRALEYLIEMRKKADRNDASILNATESRLNELEAEDALLLGTLLSNSVDESIN